MNEHSMNILNTRELLIRIAQLEKLDDLYKSIITNNNKVKYLSYKELVNKLNSSHLFYVSYTNLSYFNIFSKYHQIFLYFLAKI